MDFDVRYVTVLCLSSRMLSHSNIRDDFFTPYIQVRDDCNISFCQTELHRKNSVSSRYNLRIPEVLLLFEAEFLFCVQG